MFLKQFQTRVGAAMTANNPASAIDNNPASQKFVETCENSVKEASKIKKTKSKLFLEHVLDEEHLASSRQDHQQFCVTFFGNSQKQRAKNSPEQPTAVEPRKKCGYKRC